MTTAPHGRASPSSVGLGGPQLRWADFGHVQTAWWYWLRILQAGSWRQEERAMVLVGTVVPLVNDSSRPCTTSSVVRTRGLQCTPWGQCLLLLDCTHVARGELLQSDSRGRGAWPWVTRAGCGYGDRQAPSSNAEKDVHVHHRVGVRFLEGLKLLRFYTEFSAAPNFYTFTLLAHFLLRALCARVCPIFGKFCHPASLIGAPRPDRY